jgi:hypothetical protein
VVLAVAEDRGPVRLRIPQGEVLIAPTGWTRLIERRRSPAAIAHRIELLETELRRVRRELDASRLDEAQSAFWQRWCTFYERRLEAERALLARQNGPPAGYEVGGAVTRDGETWFEIVRVNGKSVTVAAPGIAEGYKHPLRYDCIRARLSAAEWRAAAKEQDVLAWRLLQPPPSAGGAEPPAAPPRGRPGAARGAGRSAQGRTKTGP